MFHGSWLKSHGSWLKAHGSWLMAHEKLCTTWTLPKVHKGGILADYHLVRAGNSTVTSETGGTVGLQPVVRLGSLPKPGPEAPPGLGSDVPPDQLAFPSCDGEGKFSMSDCQIVI